MGVEQSAVLETQRKDDSEPVQRLEVRGELDIETGPQLLASLRELSELGASLRLDLSGVTFIDCHGLAVLLCELRQARWRGWDLSVDRDVSRPVSRIIDLAGVEPIVWPAAAQTATSAQTS